MKSTYAPLPFSYLSSDAKPKVGLRKDGVYGTSADVPRVYQPETQDQPQPNDAGNNVYMSTEQSYDVYANANALNPGTGYRGNNQQQYQMMPAKASADHQLNGQGVPQRFQEMPPPRPQKPEGGFLVYPPSKHEDPYSVGRLPPKELNVVDQRKDDPSSDSVYRGLAVSHRSNEQQRSNGIGRVPSYYPPSVGYSADYETIIGEESPSSIYTKEPKQKQTTAVMTKDYDNFILVKDPSRPDPVVIHDEPASSANNDRRKNNNLQTLFEADEPGRQLPMYNAQPQPENHSRPTNNTRGNQESVPDRSNYAIYHGPQQLGPEFTGISTIPEQPTYHKVRPGAIQPDSQRSSDARLVKDSRAERNRTSCCVCGKCTSVVIAIIITAIVCLGAGFVAGWFGAKEAGKDIFTGSSPSTVVNEISNTNGPSTVKTSEQMSTTKPSIISSTKASITSTTGRRFAISTTSRSATSTTGSRR